MGVLAGWIWRNDRLGAASVDAPYDVEVCCYPAMGGPVCITQYDAPRTACP